MPPRWVWPDSAALTALLEVVNLGFYRGVLNQLARFETAQPDTSCWVNDLRAMARQFQFEAMGQLIEQHLNQLAAAPAATRSGNAPDASGNPL